MATSIALPPTAPINFTVSLTAAQAPYFNVWYQDMKLAGETPSAFLVRVLTPNVVDYIAQKQVKQIEGQANLDITATRNQASTIKAGL